ncbi:MAG: hypothetical protein ACLTSD_03450 [Eubacterium sp.]
MKHRMLFWLKNVRWILVGMVAFFLILLPWLSKLTSENQLWDYNTFNNYVTYLYGTLPFACVIANLLIQKEYVDGGAREILIKDHADIGMTLTNTILQMVMFLALYFYFDDSYGEVTNLLTEIVVITFFMNGIAMAVTYVTREPAITILLTLGYTVICNGKIFELVSEVVIPWRITTIRGEGLDSPYYVNFLVIGIVAWVIGITQAMRGKIV